VPTSKSATLVTEIGRQIEKATSSVSTCKTTTSNNHDYYYYFCCCCRRHKRRGEISPQDNSNLYSFALATEEHTSKNCALGDQTPDVVNNSSNDNDNNNNNGIILNEI
jgi:hypothetical protein